LVNVAPIPGFFEPFSSLAHLLAVGVVAWRGWSLVARGRGIRERIGLAAFVVGALLMFAMSGTYHSLEAEGAGRAVLKRLDHAAIWVMIAGSFSAVHALAFRGIWRWGFLALIWTIAVTGLVLKTVFFTSLPAGPGLALYLVMGWLGIATIVQLWRMAGWRTARILLFSGLAYSAGALYDQLGGPPWIPGVLGEHEVFHLAVIAGAAFHWRLLRVLLARRIGWSREPASARSDPA
jgi:channel protein (hemolysin III family)